MSGPLLKTVSTGTMLLLLLLADVAVVMARIRGENGSISLLIAVPLTMDNETAMDPGWFHMAAALLAVEHFNARNTSVVAELGDLQGCGISFGADTVVAVDTRVNSHQAMQYLVKELQQGDPVDAIAGPYNEIPALELSVLATGMEAPIVSHRAFDSNLLLPKRHPFFSQVSPDFHSEMQFISTYLQHIGRHNYIAILYSSTASEVQKVDILRSILEKDGFTQVRSFSYRAQDPTEESLLQEGQDRSVRDSLQNIKATGFRTIFVLPWQLDFDTPVIGRHAAELELDRGEHMWIMTGGVAELSPRNVEAFLLKSLAGNATFLNSLAYTMAVDQYAPLYFPDSILQYQDQAFFQRVAALNPISNYFGDDTLRDLLSGEYPLARLIAEQGSWMLGTSFMYDAVMSIGLGACTAASASEENGTAFTGKMHLDGIRAVDFLGASGRIQFGSSAGSPGSRVASTVPFAVVNLLPNNSLKSFFAENQTQESVIAYRADDLPTIEYNLSYHPNEEFQLYLHTEDWDPQTGEWTQYAAFVYADGTDSPPKRLRDESEMNYLSPSIRVVGLVLMSVALGAVFLATCWVYSNRNHTVVIAAQPVLLYALCLGSAMMALTILLSSFDENYGWDQEMLGKACVGGVWLDSLGHMVAFGALFTKLWRVNRCRANKNKQVALWRVIWPIALLIATTIILLSVWTSTGDFTWERKVIDSTTGETIGGCSGDMLVRYLFPIYTLHFVPAILAGVMAWKTTGVDDLYSESKWVLTFILLQVQVLIVGAPVVYILQDVSSDGKYMAYSLLIWTFPMSTMGMIILPKVLAVRRMKVAVEGGEPSESVVDSAGVISQADREAQDARTNRVEHSMTSERTTQPGSGSGPRIQIVTFD